ncbi:hypothetical protein HYDPIDRAFT_24091 [Hydnomerulius pinastri MD-312]|nr:hypothetical protein HYDPIDRAFT_24091 [Hydnomerulius pinastri MD-312]
MPAIVAPLPRRARQFNTLHPEMLSHEIQHIEDPFLHSETPFQTISSRSFLPPPRLLSPIMLSEPPYVALNSKSPTPCGTAHKRRAPSRLSRSTRRRRHPTRVECPFDTFGRASVFEQFPWISALEVPRSIDCDIADLSQILVMEDLAAFSDTVPASGPVRRRKTSLRSNPLGNGHETMGGELPSRQLFAHHHSADYAPSCPKTPPPRIPFDPSRVVFHNLMPVFPHGANPETPFQGFPGSP